MSVLVEERYPELSEMCVPEWLLILAASELFELCVPDWLLILAPLGEFDLCVPEWMLLLAPPGQFELCEKVQVNPSSWVDRTTACEAFPHVGIAHR